ncbi:MAG TPA: hypothetical protein DCZ20_05250 [Lachnospiraceae bacterium]|nr:hypothetical protein [Lachnospiraceae bacterium]
MLNCTAFGSILQGESEIIAAADAALLEHFTLLTRLGAGGIMIQTTIFTAKLFALDLQVQ